MSLEEDAAIYVCTVQHAPQVIKDLNFEFVEERNYFAKVEISRQNVSQIGYLAEISEGYEVLIVCDNVQQAVFEQELQIENVLGQYY